MQIKQTIILWVSALIITFLTGYLESIFSSDYPITGTIGINGQQVSYKFDKIFRGKDGYTVLIRTDLQDLKGILKWQNEDNKFIWNSVQMISGDGILHAEIPKQSPKTIAEYEVKLIWEDSTYTLPQCKIQFLGEVPRMIMFLFYFSLLGGLLFSIRTGLEYFNENQKIKKLSLFTVTFFFVLAIAVNPLKKSYELEAINKSVPNITALFDYQSLLLLFIWVVGMVIVFKLKNPKPAVLILSIITILIFFLIS